MHHACNSARPRSGLADQWTKGYVMARHDLEHDDERGHSGDWRDDDSRQHRWTGRGREFADPREQHFNRSEEGYAASRERGRGSREHDREPMGGPLPRGYRDAGYEPERGRRFADTDDRRRSQVWDWDAEYNRTVDWSPRHHSSRDSWEPREMRGHEDWERTSSERPLTHYKQSIASPLSGPHVGRGPRGYRRPDSRIYEDICELLTRHGQIDASDVDVSVEQGVVSLRGSVDGRYTKRL